MEMPRYAGATEAFLGRFQMRSARNGRTFAQGRACAHHRLFRELLKEDGVRVVVGGTS
jgi:hypothetical protein